MQVKYDCYDYNESVWLIEMVLPVNAQDIDWYGFYAHEEKLKKSYWQVPYLEQYLNFDDTGKLYKTYLPPENDDENCRVVFFIYKTDAKMLRTPYGEFELVPTASLSDALNAIVEFEDCD